MGLERKLKKKKKVDEEGKMKNGSWKRRDMHRERKVRSRWRKDKKGNEERRMKKGDGRGEIWTVEGK